MKKKSERVAVSARNYIAKINQRKPPYFDYNEYEKYF